MSFCPILHLFALYTWYKHMYFRRLTWTIHLGIPYSFWLIHCILFQTQPRMYFLVAIFCELRDISLHYVIWYARAQLYICVCARNCIYCTFFLMLKSHKRGSWWGDNLWGKTNLKLNKKTKKKDLWPFSKSIKLQSQLIILMLTEM